MAVHNFEECLAFGNGVGCQMVAV